MESARANTRRGSGAGGFVLLVLVAGLIGAGAGVWHLRKASKFDPAAEISIEEYFDMKRMKKIREVWLEGSDLYAETEPAFVQDGRAFRFVHAAAPPAYLGQPAGLNELRAGIDPSRFTVLR